MKTRILKLEIMFLALNAQQDNNYVILQKGKFDKCLYTSAQMEVR